MKKAKLISTVFALSMLHFSCSGQSETQTFLVGDYLLSPDKKEIFVYTPIGGENWEGVEYVRDSTLQYDKVTLYMVEGNGAYLDSKKPKVEDKEWNYGFGSFDDEFDNNVRADLDKKYKKVQVIAKGSKLFFIENGGKTFRFPSAIKDFEGVIENYAVIHTSKGFYASRYDEVEDDRKLDSLLFFNFDTKQYEPLEADKYRYISRDFLVYKNRLYDFENYPIKEDIDFQHLEYVKYQHQNTHYMSDGKKLIYVESGSAKTEGEKAEKMRVPEKNCVTDVDFSSLKVITPDILVDKNNIYNANYDGIHVIPRASLKMKIEIL